MAESLSRLEGGNAPRMPPGLELPELSDNAVKVLEKRYLLRDSQGTVKETPAELFWRVAWNIAQADRLYGAAEQQVMGTAKRFYRLMAELDFLPNSPTLMNAGTEMQQLSACFVLPVGDNLPAIFDAIKQQALIHQSGGGTGFGFSRLRPKGDFVKSTMGVASGPVSFMKIFNAATQEIKQGGKRRGANMGILRVDHPDIEEFITCKDNVQEITNFNISVAITDEFMRAAKEGRKYDLVNPRDGKAVKQLDARAVLQKVANQAWKNGEPGLFFLDRSNDHCPTKHITPIEATNPCGEQDLQPYDSCNLGSIDLQRHVTHASGRPDVDWAKLEETVRQCTHFLDNVIDMNNYPIPEIREMSLGNRRIGLGIMGFARLLFAMGISYDSEEGLEMAERVMKFINQVSADESCKLAQVRGPYANWKGSTHEKAGILRRNSYVTTIAPTGTLSMIADTSGGCEPEFSLVWYKNVMDGTHLPYICDPFVAVAKREGWWREGMMEQILANRGSARGVKGVPEKWQRVFAVSFDITSEWHVRMQAAFQAHVEAQVSKTINLPTEATVEDVQKSYMLAYELGCRGITVYRDASRPDQVLNVGESEKLKAKEPAAQQVLAKEEPKAAPKPIQGTQVGTGKTVLKPRPRPDVITGTTQRVETGYGHLYVTINEDEHGLFEVFAQIGHGGGYTASFTEAVARLLSLCLRSGVPVEEVVEQLEGIRSPKVAWDHGERVYSVPDALAKALNRQVSGELHKSIQARVDAFGKQATPMQQAKPVAVIAVDEEVENEAGPEATKALVRRGDSPECPECEQMLSFEEGCTKCHGCGYSEC
ncbi:MAG: vitamin B12-dependent ribonucleotide reductase [Halobacteriales archaeon]|nr:vitamin B12-dependent ribonucleotide reductase [Halobacteriales archaeon]